MMKFKPHYDFPGSAVLYIAPGDIYTTPHRMLRSALLGGDVTLAVFHAVNRLDAWSTSHFFKSLGNFVTCCQRKWEFSASIADRFTRPGAVFN